MMSVAAVILGGAYGASARRRHAARRYSFRGRTVLLSGGARGLGLALARLFAREGAHVVVFSPADELKASRDLDLGRAAAFMPSSAARRFNQPVAVGETVR
jgi:NAD(P)-dependent dehydrogenase (short-subunit alcohol dehydrogenase family)